MTCRWRGVGGGVALAMLLTGCAAGVPARNVSSSPSPVVASALPAGGVYLRAVGFSGQGGFFTNAPPTFSIPAGVQPVSGANLPELINVVFAGGDGPVVRDYLVANLASMGYSVTAQSTDSIVWQGTPGATWSGAFTMTPAQAGLTLRRG